jgi:hypothetical protein
MIDWLLLLPLVKLFFQNPILGSFLLLTALTVYFWLAFRIHTRLPYMPPVFRYPGYIFVACFVVSNVIVNLTACTFIFRDVYIVKMARKRGAFRLGDLMISKRLAWYKRGYDEQFGHFHDWRDKVAKFLIKIVLKIDKYHFS